MYASNCGSKMPGDVTAAGSSQRWVSSSRMPGMIHSRENTNKELVSLYLLCKNLKTHVTALLIHRELLAT